MASLEQLEKEIENIKERNARVEIDKAWETSKTRKSIIAIGTYVMIAIFLYAAGIPNPFLNASIPALAFLLSTLMMPPIKEFWKKHMYKK